MEEHSAKCKLTPFPEDPYFDESDPRNLINLLPTWLKLAAKALPVKYLEMTEDELKTLVFLNKSLAYVAKRIKIAFWEEYDRVQAHQLQTMNINGVLKGQCTMNGFRRFIEDYPQFLAWLLMPATDYMLSMNEILDMGQERMKEILSQSAIVGGAVDARLAKVQHAIYETMLDRVKGAVVQTINQKSLNVNMNTNASDSVAQKANAAALTDLSEIDKRIAQLREKSAALAAPPTMPGQDVGRLIQPNTNTIDAEIVERK